MFAVLRLEFSLSSIAAILSKAEVKEMPAEEFNAMMEKKAKAEKK